MTWLNHAVLHVAGILVREPDLVDWLEDWKSELWYVQRESGEAALRFCLGAFADALWMRRNHEVQPRRFSRLESPLYRLAYLAGAAAIAIFCFFAWFRAIEPIFHKLDGSRGLISLNLGFMAVALIVLPATTSLALGEYPSGRLRRWAFLLSKFVLIFPVVCLGALDLSPILPAPVLVDVWLLGYVLGFRWAIVDQRRRCPVCLRLLTCPARFGTPSHSLLDSYGTEFFCSRGHGLLHVPENRTSFSTQRWLDLDPSWRSLFSGRPT